MQTAGMFIICTFKLKLLIFLVFYFLLCFCSFRQLLSAIQRALQLGEFSEEAAITSLECQVNVPVRQSVSVLW